MKLKSVLLPLAVAVAFITSWHFAVKWTGSDIFPTPGQVVSGTVELIEKGVLVKYVVASLFRVVAGYLLAVFIGIPLGLLMGWFVNARIAFNPAIQVLRPISPIAWIPVAILWFGVSDAAPIFLIFLASLFPITTAAMAAVQNIQMVYIRSLPQILTGLRLALGVAWLVVVAAEMIAVNSGLGYLIIDARNAGKRYDLVVAGMAMIGFIGLGLDWLVRRMETLDEVRWGISR
jgi:NitT/TauT family transport system permease protein